MWRLVLTLCVSLEASLANACETALLLTMDVSNSVDPGEYRLQVDGLADALQDPAIAEILVRDQVALAVIQWSGVASQHVTLPWTRMRSALDVARFSAAARAMPRAFVLSDTAPAEALAFALNHFGEVADCARRIVDVSGDGTPNAGSEVGPMRRRAERLGVTINGIAIESLGIAISNFYRRTLVTKDGFVVTARGHRDYPRAIRLKILREISKVMS
ncbi:DUF1194 domain-containing protein [Puniceibacterium confluentis]|uniref:DUF1194 domain-containing protein n=1 Tax=Puniceibacterium confluentis TaxID=1958944 RepID=UPI0011B6E13A|nr:DUF1194 domain-containing protein [Puniceibacterium confluentis]